MAGLYFTVVPPLRITFTVTGPVYRNIFFLPLLVHCTVAVCFYRYWLLLPLLVNFTVVEAITGYLLPLLVILLWLLAVPLLVILFFFACIGKKKAMVGFTNYVPLRGGDFGDDQLSC